MDEGILIAGIFGVLIAFVTLGGLTLGVRMLFSITVENDFSAQKRRVIMIVSVLVLVGQLLLSGFGLHYGMKQGLNSIALATGMVFGIFSGVFLLRFFEPKVDDSSEKKDQ